MNTAAQIREFLAFADSTDLKVLQDAVDEVKALYRNMMRGNYSFGEIALAAEAQFVVLNALSLRYNELSAK